MIKNQNINQAASCNFSITKSLELQVDIQQTLLVNSGKLLK